MYMQHEDGYHETRREGTSITIDLRARGALAPTLAQINSRNARHSTKRVKQESSSRPTTTYHTSDHDLTLSLEDRHPLPSLGDSSNLFDVSGDAAITDPLSASFKSLYKSIFGHSVSSGEYLNPPPLPPTVLTDLGSSDTSIPLGGSALSILGGGMGGPMDGASNYCPHFYTLMDSFRDIAESNSWDKLEPEQVHGLMQSFKAVERDRLGLDDESYSRVSSSFEQFLQQLSCRFVADSSGDESGGGRDHHVAADLEEYQSNLPGVGGSAAQPLVASLPPPNYPENPEMFPISGASPPPPPNYCSQPLTLDPPSPTRPNSRTHMSPHHFTPSSSPHTTQLLPSTAQSNRTDFKFLHPTAVFVGHVGMDRHTGADIASGTPFENEDDDDFDWSTIM